MKKHEIKVIGFNSNVVSAYIKEAREVEKLQKEITKKRIFGWKPQSVMSSIKKAQKWANNGWYSTPHMRHFLETL